MADYRGTTLYTLDPQKAELAQKMAVNILVSQIELCRVKNPFDKVFKLSTGQTATMFPIDYNIMKKAVAATVELGYDIKMTEKSNQSYHLEIQL